MKASHYSSATHAGNERLTMTPLIAYLLGLMTFPAAMGMVFYTRLMRVALEQARQQIEAEIEAERAEDEEEEKRHERR